MQYCNLKCLFRFFDVFVFLRYHGHPREEAKVGEAKKKNKFVIVVNNYYFKCNQIYHY